MLPILVICCKLTKIAYRSISNVAYIVNIYCELTNITKITNTSNIANLYQI